MNEEYGVPEKPEKRSSFDVSRAQARKLSIGDMVKITIAGEVCGISRGYGGMKGDVDPYHLEVKFRQMPMIEANGADSAMRDLMGMENGRYKNEADKSLDDIYQGKERTY